MRFIFLLLAVFIISGCNPFKVTDPNNSRFDVTRFDFNDYKNHTEMAYVMRGLFKIGTPRSEIEKIFIEYGGASAADKTDAGRIFDNIVRSKINVDELLQNSERVIVYGKEGKISTFGWRIYIFYDQDDRLIQAVSNQQLVFI